MTSWYYAVEKARMKWSAMRAASKSIHLNKLSRIKRFGTGSYGAPWTLGSLDDDADRLSPHVSIPKVEACERGWVLVVTRCQQCWRISNSSLIDCWHFICFLFIYTLFTVFTAFRVRLLSVRKFQDEERCSPPNTCVQWWTKNWCSLEITYKHVFVDLSNTLDERTVYYVRVGTGGNRFGWIL